MSQEHDHVAAWLEAEYEYATGKWPETTTDLILVGHHDEPDLNGVGPGSEYRRWVLQYMHRAHVLGLDNPLGRQALAKALRTLMACTETTVRLYGPIPPAGVSSGNLS